MVALSFGMATLPVPSILALAFSLVAAISIDFVLASRTRSKLVLATAFSNKYDPFTDKLDK